MRDDYPAGSTIYVKFNTVKSRVLTTLAGTPAAAVYKGGSTTESTAGVTLTVDYDSRTGYHCVVIDTSADGTFYASGNDFDVVLTAGTVGGDSVVGAIVGAFSLDKQTAKADVTKIGGVAQSDQYVKVSSGTGTGQVDLSSGKVLLQPAQTGVTIPTVTNVTNDVGITQGGADKVWTSAARTLTSFGTLVADIWAALLTGITTVGSIGKLIKDNLDAAISTRAAEATLTAIKGAGWTTDTLVSLGNQLVALGTPLQAGDYVEPPSAATIADSILDEPLSGHLTAGTAGAALSDAASGGSAPTASQVADAVWDEALSGHAAAGSAGEALATAGSGGIPSDVLDQIDAIEAIVTALQASAVLVQSNTIGIGGTVRMFYGLDYKQVDGRAVSWINEAGSWPNLTGATISVLDFDTRASLGGTGTVVTATGANQTVRWEVAKTVFVSAASKKYILKATLSNNDEIDLTEGSLLIR